MAFDINSYLCGVFITQDGNIKLLLSTPDDVLAQKCTFLLFFFILYFFFLL